MSKWSTQARCIAFNQDCSCLAVGTDIGYRIYTTDPVRKCYEKRIAGGMRIVSMLYCTSLLAIVGAGSSHSPRQLQLFNTQDDQVICDISFQDTILSVRLNKKRLVVILEKCLHIFDLTQMAPLQIIDTEPNPKGLGALSMSEDQSVVAYPKAVSPGCGDVMVIDATAAANLHVIRAHKTPLSALCLSNDGKKLATASGKGTVIRVFGISPGRPEAPLLYALRRGSSPATVYSLSFDSLATLLVCTSNKPTIHIWKCDTPLDNGTAADVNSVGAAVRSIYQAERSWAHFASPNPNTSNIAALSKDSKRVFVGTMDGHLYIHSLQLGTGECKREAEYVIASND